MAEKNSSDVLFMWIRMKQCNRHSHWVRNVKEGVSSTAETVQITGVVTQSGRRHLWSAQSVLPSNLQVDKLDLPTIVHGGADEAKYLLKDAQTGCISVDGPSYSHQHEAMRGGQGLEAVRLQVWAEEEALLLG